MPASKKVPPTPAEERRKKNGISPRAAKAKGRRLQQRVRDEILLAFPELEPGDVTSTPMGVNGADVTLSPLAQRIFPMQVECKHYAKLAIYSFWDQAKSHGKHEPLLVLKSDLKPVLCVVTMEHYFDLVKKANRK